MGGECNPCKRHYDLSMSKRTRKPVVLPTTVKSPERLDYSFPSDPIEDSPEKQNSSSSSPTVRKTCLKELFAKEEMKVIVGNEEAKHGEGGKNSLGNHFNEEEKQQKVLVKQQEQGLEAVKFNGVISRYARILSRLIKPDHRLGSAKKPVLRLAI